MSTGNLEVPKPLSGTGGWLDDRFHGARGFRVLMRKVFPDHWSFMLGEIALWSFVILLLTGTFLSLFFVPSMNEVVYHGSYTKLNGIQMSEAYQSTLNISFDVRGGLLMRQIHHWAGDLFMASLIIHMLRIFFTGAYRKPREVNWLIGIVMLTLSLLEGLAGYSLRGRDEPTASTPVTWAEVDRCAHSGDPATLRFTADQVLERIEEHGDLFADV